MEAKAVDIFVNNILKFFRSISEGLDEIFLYFIRNKMLKEFLKF